MNAAIVLLWPLMAFQQTPGDSQTLDRLHALYAEEAASWQIHLDAERRTRANLVDRPIYMWTNPTRSDGQHGLVFVWTHAGRPVAVGTVFSQPEAGRRMLHHELHALARSRLYPSRPAGERWEPRAGVSSAPIPGAPLPAPSPARRLVQLRELSRQFTAHSIDFQKERWELRLLPQPLFRYEQPEGDVIDGALFAFVTSAGTDPEVVLLIEARGEGDAAAWQYSAVRFSDSDLYLQHQGKHAWSSIRDERNQLHFNPDHTYRLIRDRYIDDAAAASGETP